MRGLSESVLHRARAAQPITIHRARATGQDRLERTEVGIFTENNPRRFVDQGGVPEDAWKPVGQIISRNRGTCTATVVARCLVVTAAECAIDPRTGQMSPDVRFSSPHTRATATARLYFTDSQNAFSRNRDQRQNWVILVMDQPVGDRTGFAKVMTGWSEQNPETQNWLRQTARNMVMPGYHSDMDQGRRMAADTDVSVRATRDGLLLHDGDAWDGSMGSPLMARVDGEWVMMGMNTQTAYGEDAQRRPINPRIARWDLRNAGRAVPTDYFATTLQQLLPHDCSLQAR